MKKLIEILKNNKEFCLASLLAVGTGLLDCYLTCRGLKDGVGYEGMSFYKDLYHFFGDNSIYLGKILLITPLMLISKRNNNILPLKAASLTNAVGAGSWVLAYLV